MRTINLGKSTLQVPVIAVGCMRMNDIERKDVQRLIGKALELGVNFFDHADIYGGYTCEEIFAEAFWASGAKREDIILQSKCGIVPGVMYDFSKEHIIKSVENSLKKLRTDYLDVLLLHRPDALMEPEEVAEAFDMLYQAGKVKYFGVSNQKPMQIQLLQKYVKQDLLVNQLQLSITNSNMIGNGLEVNMLTEGAVDRDGSILDFCRLNDITIQAWSPFQYGFFEGVFLGNEKFPELNRKLNELAAEYQVSATTIAAAWLLRHPAGMQVISGTMNPKRLEEICKAADITLTRKQWYEIYMAAGNQLP